MTTTEQTRVQFLTEALVEVLNNQWKVDAIESGYISVTIKLKLKKEESISNSSPG